MTRDYITGEQFAELMRSRHQPRRHRRHLRRQEQLVGAYALWVFTLFGHSRRAAARRRSRRLANEDRDTSFDVPEFPRSADYLVVERDDSRIRAFAADVRSAIGTVPLVDALPAGVHGERTHMPDYPQEGALRGGHIPTAVSILWPRPPPRQPVPWPCRARRRVRRTRPEHPTIAYCRIGERSSHTWFVLTYPLGFDDVRNYDGSWTEWGNTVRAPIAVGEEPRTALA